MYQNGFTRKKVMEQIKKYNHGYPARKMSSCYYRASDGNRCLVGCFIPDDKYDESMEDKRADVIISEYGLNSVMPFDASDMECLQSFHDELYDEDYEGDENKFYELVEKQLIEMERIDEVCNGRN